MRNAVLAGVILSPEPPTRWRLGQAIGVRFVDVFESWDPSHAYPHVRTLVGAQLLTPIGPSGRPRLRANPAGVDVWRRWLASPVDPRMLLRDTLARLRACRDRDFATMLAIVDLCEAEVHRALERLDPVDAAPLTARFARNARRNGAVAMLRWCQETRDEISAVAVSGIQ